MAKPVTSSTTSLVPETSPETQVSTKRLETLEVATANLLAWLRSMHQEGGFGGPVAHWWQNRFRYTGIGLDWRYEGILIGYKLLASKTGDVDRFRSLTEQAVSDLRAGQTADGHLTASRFEMNPDTVGTPHEAAASLGLLEVLPLLTDPEPALECAKRNVDALIQALWDEPRRGFNDGLHAVGRVPNKLATFAQTLMTLANVTGDDAYLDYARAALDDVINYQLTDGPQQGAIHQYAANAARGDGRFFPYYNARCIPPLVMGAQVLADARYQDAAELTLNFLTATMNPDGSWPQIVYQGGARAMWARWFAGTADTLLAYHALGEMLPDAAVSRLLSSQLASGGFMTAEGFASQISQRAGAALNYRDVMPVVGWNDKVLRLLSTLLPKGTSLPDASTQDTTVAIRVGQQRAIYEETHDFIRIYTLKAPNTVLYDWKKSAPWAHVVHFPLEVR
ncbi:MAG: hypothetical protein AAF708_16395 [Deinococcota bacterium]